MKNIFAVLLMTGLIAQPLPASDDHDHEAAAETAPRGGTLRDSPPYKAELLLKGDTAKIFLYVKPKTGTELEEVALDKDKATGKLRFPKEKNEKTITFNRVEKCATKTKKMPDGKMTEVAVSCYQAELKGINKVHRYDLHVILEAQGKKVMADFGVDNIH